MKELRWEAYDIVRNENPDLIDQINEAKKTVDKLSKQIDRKAEKVLEELQSKVVSEDGKLTWETAFKIHAEDMQTPSLNGYGLKATNDWYDQFEQMVEELPGVYNGGGYYNGEDDDPANGQKILQVCFDKAKPLKEQLGIEVPLEHMQKNKDGWIYIDIFEHTLSEHGVYFIEYYNKRKARVMKTTYGTTREVFSGTWKKVLEYVHQNLWYEDSNREDYS